MHVIIKMWNLSSITDTGTQRETFTTELTITRKPQHMFMKKYNHSLKIIGQNVHVHSGHIHVSFALILSAFFK